MGAASSGKLTFMVGGAEEEFTAAKELLSCMGANVVYCGQVGTGQVGERIFYFLIHISSRVNVAVLNIFSMLFVVCSLLNSVFFIFLQAAKICNNMLLAIGMIGTSETMNLGIR